jgi:hypothetical protein
MEKGVFGPAEARRDQWGDEKPGRNGEDNPGAAQRN